MNQYKKGVIYTIIGGACWGISGTCGEYLCTFKGMDTRLLTDIRLLGAGLVLCLFMFWRYRPNVKLLLKTPNAVLHCIVFGIGGLMFTQYAYLTAIAKTNAGTATVLQYLSAIFVLLIVCLRKRKLPVLRENIAIVSCLVGTFLVATHGSFTSLYISKQGLFWGFLAAVAATLYILIPQQLLADWGSIIPTGIGMLTGGIAFFFIMRVWKISVKLDLTTVVITVLIVLVGTVLASEGNQSGWSGSRKYAWLCGTADGNGMLSCFSGYCVPSNGYYWFWIHHCDSFYTGKELVTKK